jgi:hypothetical protein
MTDVTRLLNALKQGDPQAASRLLPLVEDELPLHSEHASSAGPSISAGKGLCAEQRVARRAPLLATWLKWRENWLWSEKVA